MRPVPPGIGATVAIDVADEEAGGVRTLRRRIGTIRDHGDGRYTCVVVDETGAAETVTIAPNGRGWVCVDPPADIQAAMYLSDRVLRGEVLHGSATAPLLLLARAVQQLTRPARPAGPACPARIDEERGR